MERRKRVKMDLEQREKEKQNSKNMLTTREQLLDDIPRRVNLLSDSLRDIQQTFGIPISKHPDQIQMSKLLSSPLYILYQKFISVRESNLDTNFEVIIEKARKDRSKNGEQEEFEYFVVLQLQRDEKLEQKYRFLQELKVESVASTFKSLFPLSLRFGYLEDQKVLYVGVEHNYFLHNDELFIKLVNGEIGISLFKAPTSEKERYLNTRYRNFEWLQRWGREVRHESLDDLTKERQYFQGFISHLRSRVYNRLCLSYTLDHLHEQKRFNETLFDNMKKSYPRLIVDMSDKNVALPTISYWNKINPQDFITELALPRWIANIVANKNIDDFPEESLDINDNFNDRLEQIVRFKKSLLSKLAVSSNLVRVLHDVSPLEIGDSAFQDSFYKFEINQGPLILRGVVKFDHSYPSVPAFFHLRAFKKFEKKVKQLPEELRGKFVHRVSHRKAGDKICYYHQIKQIENYINFTLPQEAKSNPLHTFYLQLYRLKIGLLILADIDSNSTRVPTTKSYKGRFKDIPLKYIYPLGRFDF
eukprot:TRINITY_DN12520_c0_g1_i1.p1 TRINITY_DN12520_c0_g1~~TRINITY_DN12520_c0_g1_i1.p1  ORF type:complete len:530 (-),score=133.95 TRINITY_DN12520_c0_g1_i1:155-1744(-)